MKFYSLYQKYIKYNLSGYFLSKELINRCLLTTLGLQQSFKATVVSRSLLLNIMVRKCMIKFCCKANVEHLVKLVLESKMALSTNLSIKKKRV